MTDTPREKVRPLENPCEVCEGREGYTVIDEPTCESCWQRKADRAPESVTAFFDGWLAAYPADVWPDAPISDAQAATVLRLMLPRIKADALERLVVPPATRASEVTDEMVALAATVMAKQYAGRMSSVRLTSEEMENVSLTYIGNAREILTAALTPPAKTTEGT